MELMALCGVVLAGASVISNDAVQTLGTFMSSNKQTGWKKQWLFASVIMVATALYSWFMYGGDISFGRLDRFPFQEIQWYHALAPAVLLLLTRAGIPVSTTFLVLSAFASQFVFAKMLIKSALGYAIAAVVAYVGWLVISKLIDENKEISKESEPRWRVAQWCTTGFLWFTWLSHDLANIAVFLPRQLTLPVLAGLLVFLVSLLGFIFWERGGKIQEVVTEKAYTQYVRSATIIDGVYALVLLYFKNLNNIPMSTTWVFVGLLCGRELAIATLQKNKFVDTLPAVFRDFLKIFSGLAVSVGIVVLIHTLKG